MMIDITSDVSIATFVNVSMPCTSCFLFRLVHVRKWWLFGEIDLVEVEIVEVNYLIYLFALCEDCR